MGSENMGTWDMGPVFCDPEDRAQYLRYEILCSLWWSLNIFLICIMHGWRGYKEIGEGASEDLYLQIWGGGGSSRLWYKKIRTGVFPIL